MRIPELNLDNLTWSDLVDLGRRAVPAASEGTWTLHSPVDPGITLLELFASELEQRLFTLDQVPETLVRSAMRLMLGKDAGPRPAQAATAVLALQTTSGPVVVPAGTEINRVLNGPQLVLTTAHRAVAVPDAKLTSFVVGGAEQLPKLSTGFPVPVFGRTGRSEATLQITAGAPAPEHLLYFGVEDQPTDRRWPVGQTAPPPPTPGAEVSAPSGGLGWLGDDDRPAMVDGEGRAVQPDRFRALTVPQSQQLSWEALVGDAHWPLTPADGTGGLRVAGIVRLQPPDGKTFPARFSIRVSPPPSGCPGWPRVIAIAVNAVIVAHRHQVDEQLNVADSLPRPNREIVLRSAAPNVDRPLDRIIDDPRLMSVSVRAPSGDEETWTAVDDLAFSTPDDKHFQADRRKGRLRFGDGTAGRIPRWPESSRIAATYWVGAGVPPDIGPRTSFNGPPESDLTGATVTRLTWGRETESAASARARAAAELGQTTRAVTVEDISTILLSVPGIRLSRVHVQQGRDPDHPGAVVPDAASVFCIPQVSRRDADDLYAVPAPDLDDWSRRVLATVLDQARLTGARLSLQGPAYRRVRVRVRLDMRTRDRASVQRQTELTVRHLLDPLIGGQDGKGWPFGDPLAPTDLTVAVQRAVGRQAEVIAVAISFAGSESFIDCDALPLRPHELPAVVEVCVVPASRGGS